MEYASLKILLRRTKWKTGARCPGEGSGVEGGGMLSRTAWITFSAPSWRLSSVCTAMALMLSGSVTHGESVFHQLQHFRRRCRCRRWRRIAAGERSQRLSKRLMPLAMQAVDNQPTAAAAGDRLHDAVERTCSLSTSCGSRRPAG